MDDARKEYVNIERLFSGDIFGMLDSIESGGEGDIEDVMNDSDTEFVAEDELIISIILLVKKRSVTKLAPYQFQKHQSTFFLPKTRIKPIL